MDTSLKKEIEVPKVRRQSDTWDGKVMEYLLKHPSKKPINELIMEAVTNYWLVEALAFTVNEQELITASLSAIGALEGKLIIARSISGMPKVSNSHQAFVERSFTVPPTTVMEKEALDQAGQNNHSVQSEEEQQASEVEAEDENLGLLDIKLTDDLRIATQLLGFEESNGNKSL